jgi:hypothetical protein
MAEESRRDSSMEEDLLNDMINERNKKIVHLTEIIESKEAKVERTKLTLENCRKESLEDRLSHIQEIEDLTKKRTQAMQTRQNLERSVRQQNGSLHNYAEILKEAAPNAIDSSYVVRMQSQLCKAMHSMGILEHQLDIVKDYCGDIVKLTKEGMNGIIEQRSQMEVTIMNELMIIDAAVREIKGEFKMKMDKKQKEIQVLQDSIRSFESDSDDEDSDECSDEDIEIDDDLLKEIIAERRGEIATQETENNVQLSRIKQLEGKIKALQLTNSNIQPAAGSGDESQ